MKFLWIMTLLFLLISGCKQHRKRQILATNDNESWVLTHYERDTVFDKNVSLHYSDDIIDLRFKVDKNGDGMFTQVDFDEDYIKAPGSLGEQPYLFQPELQGQIEKGEKVKLMLFSTNGFSDMAIHYSYFSNKTQSMDSYTEDLVCNVKKDILYFRASRGSEIFTFEKLKDDE